MSVPEGTKPWWPLRPAGFALLGLAAAAAATGLVLVVSEDGPDVGSGRGPATSGQAPGSASAPPSAAPGPRPTATSPATPAPVAPPAPVPAGPTPAKPAPAPPGPAPAGPATPAPGTDSDVAGSGKGGKGGKGDSRGAARVYNNSTIRGLAARAANDLTAAGYPVAEVGNYSQGRIWTTTVYYQEGTDQRATAEAIGAEFGMRVEPRFPGIVDAAPGVIVIVTNDYGS